MRTFYVTVEGVVSRVERVEANNIADAMDEAKREFKNRLGADNAQIITINEEKTNG